MAPSCCPEGSEPLREMEDYKAKHDMTRVHSLNCYVATPAQATSKGVIMPLGEIVTGNLGKWPRCVEVKPLMISCHCQVM